MGARIESIEKSRKALAKAIGAHIKPESRVIPFRNDDVPKFLKRLNRIEAESFKSYFVIK